MARCVTCAKGVPPQVKEAGVSNRLLGNCRSELCWIGGVLIASRVPYLAVDPWRCDLIVSQSKKPERWRESKFQFGPRHHFHLFEEAVEPAWNRPEEKGPASPQALDYLARPAGIEPTTPWFVGPVTSILLFNISYLRRLFNTKSSHV